MSRKSLSLLVTQVGPATVGLIFKSMSFCCFSRSPSRPSYVRLGGFYILAV